MRLFPGKKIPVAGKRSSTLGRMFNDSRFQQMTVNAENIVLQHGKPRLPAIIIIVD